MGDSPHQNTTRLAAANLGRRQFMRRAAVAGTLVWAVPTIVSIEPAGAADRHSAPPKPPKPPVEPVGGVVSPPPAVGAAETTNPDGGQLPFTGDNEVVELGVGVAAIAGGAALFLLSGEEPRAIPEDA